jgi:hypothetical protein
MVTATWQKVRQKSIQELEKARTGKPLASITAARKYH